jgi:hypothetical protein
MLKETLTFQRETQAFWQETQETLRRGFFMLGGP